MAANGSDLEIERKFLVRAPWPMATKIHTIRQLYINPGAPISVRLRDTDGVFSLTMKKGRSALVRTEFNVPVEAGQGQRMLAQLASGTSLIEKQRHIVPQNDVTWEVDAFGGVNQGLVVAEVELEHEAQAFDKPDWLGREVTHDPRFTNHALFLHPFSRWAVHYADLLAGA
jgi:adenylate cyclase